MSATSMQAIDFKNIKADYVNQYHRDMQVITHRFLYTCFHPSDADRIINLEMNIYPRDLKFYDVYQKGANQDGNDDIVSIQDMDQGDDEDDDTDETNTLEEGEKDSEDGNFKSFDDLGVIDEHSQADGLEINAKSAAPSEYLHPSYIPLDEKRYIQLKKEKEKQEENMRKQREFELGKTDKGEHMISEEILDTETLKSQKSPPKKANKIKERVQMLIPFGVTAKKQMKEYEQEASEQEGTNKYAISQWTLNKGDQCMQVAEYGFDGSLVNDRFYVSHDGGTLFFFQFSVPSEDTNLNNAEIRRVVFLDIESLTERTEDHMRPYYLPSSVKETKLMNAQLVFECQLLVLQFEETYMMIQMTNREVVAKTFVSNFRQSTSFIDKQYFLSGMFFNEDEKGQIYFWIKNQDNNDKAMTQQFNQNVSIGDIEQPEEEAQWWLIKSDLYQPYTTFFNSQDKLFSLGDEKVIWTIKGNANLPCGGNIYDLVHEKCMKKWFFVAPGQIESLQIASDFKHSLSKKETQKVEAEGPIQDKRVVLTARYHMQVQKNHFLYSDTIWGIGVNSSRESFIVNLLDLKQEYILKKMHDYSENKREEMDDLRDVRYISAEEGLMVTGIPKDQSPVISVNHVKIDTKSVTHNLVQELSEFKCNYPFIYFCKGNIEIFFQSIFTPDKISKFTLRADEQFLCFCDFNVHKSYGKGVQLAQNRTVAYLSQVKNKIILNFIIYDDFSSAPRTTFTLYQSDQYILRDNLPFGQVKSACVIQADRKGAPYDEDTLLVIQYRKAMHVKSFRYATFNQDIDNGKMAHSQMLYLPGSKFEPDQIFFARKRSGITTEICRLSYSKEAGESLQIVMVLKSHHIKLFSYLEGQFYIMDESMVIRIFEYDEELARLKQKSTSAFNSYGASSMKIEEWDDIQVTPWSLYHKSSVYQHFDTSEQVKFQVDGYPLFLSTNITSGPIAVPGVSFMMYLVQGYKSHEGEIDISQSIGKSLNLKRFNTNAMLNSSQMTQRLITQMEAFEGGETEEDKMLKEGNEPNIQTDRDNPNSASPVKESPQNKSQPTEPKEGDGPQPDEANLSQPSIKVNGGEMEDTKSFDQNAQPGLNPNPGIKVSGPSPRNSQQIDAEEADKEDEDILKGINETKKSENPLEDARSGYHTMEGSKSFFSGGDPKKPTSIEPFRQIDFKNSRDDQPSKIIFLPNAQSRVVSMLFNPLSDENQTGTNGIMYPEVQMSTFIDDKNILVRCDNRYMHFMSNGHFVGFVKVKGQKNFKNLNNLDLLLISDNQKFFLFKQKEKGKTAFYVLELLKEGESIFFAQKEKIQIEFDKDEMNKSQLGVLPRIYPPVYTLNNEGDVYFAYCSEAQQFKLQVNNCPAESCNSAALNFDARGLPTFRMFIVKNYFFLLLTNQRQVQEIWFMKIYLDVGEEGKKTLKAVNPKDMGANRLLNLRLESNQKITRIVSTYHPDFFQITVNDLYEDAFTIITWDLDKNIEYSMLQIDDFCGLQHPERYIVKGLNPKLNYVVTPTNFYDLQFNLPMTFHSDPKISSFEISKQRRVNERKLNSDNNLHLPASVMSQIMLSYGLMDIQYWITIQAIEHEELSQQLVLPEHFYPRFGDKTIFHQYAIQPKMLEMLLNETKKSEGVENLRLSELFLGMLYPNGQLESAFDIAITNQSLLSVDLMLEMLILSPNYSTSKFIRRHFNTLFRFGIQNFESYLETCFFKHYKMEKTHSFRWEIEAEEVLIDYHTSFLDKHFFDTQLQPNIVRKKESKKWNCPKCKKEPPSLPKTEEELEIDKILMYDTVKELEQKKEKRVNIKGLEFDWIFFEEGMQFTRNLSISDNDNLFAIDTIRVLILLQWQKFKYYIVKWLFIPFMIYFCLFVLYLTVIRENLEDSKSHTHPKGKVGWHVIDKICMVIICIFIVFFMITDYLKTKKSTYMSYWRILDLASHVFNITLLIMDWGQRDRKNMRGFCALAVFIMWLKLFYFLRLFDSTAPLVRMIIQIIQDMTIFSFVLFLAIGALTNAFIILDYNRDADTKFMEDGYFMGLLYTYRIGLGDFQISKYPFGRDKNLLYFLFFLATALIQIILLNLLIAIMGNTYSVVSEISEMTKLKEICSMISENEFLFNRKKIFKSKKYIIICQLEKTQGISGNDISSQIQKLENTFSNIAQEQNMINKNRYEYLKKEIGGIQEQQEVNLRETRELNEQTIKEAKEMHLETIKQINELKETLLEEYNKKGVANKQQQSLTSKTRLNI